MEQREMPQVTSVKRSSNARDDGSTVISARFPAATASAHPASAYEMVETPVTEVGHVAISATSLHCRQCCLPVDRPFHLWVLMHT